MELIIHRHHSKDSARFLRAAARLELVRRSKKTHVLFVSHNMGGGCERHIRELAGCFRDSLEILTARPSGKNALNLYFGTRRRGNALHFQMPRDYGELIKLCRYLAISRMHYHHLMLMHPHIHDLPGDLEVPYDVTLHDYYFINGNPTLTDKRGYFAGETGLWGQHMPAGCVMPHGASDVAWKEMHRRLLLGADRVIAPSSYTAQVYHSYFPGLSPTVAYHLDREKNGLYPAVQRKPLASGENLKIVILGALNREKGADLLDSVARISRGKRLPLRFHLIGYAYRPLDKAVTVHGPYEDSMLKRHITGLDPHVVWFPALCPEVYSYTLSTALELGLPVIAPDIGAFPERLAHRPLTWIRTWDSPPGEWAAFFEFLKSSVFPDIRSGPTPWDDQPKTSWCYGKNYLTEAKGLQEKPSAFRPDREWIERFLSRDIATAKERLLSRLLQFRFHPVLGKLGQVFPYRVEQRVKRWLSRRPIHEIMR